MSILFAIVNFITKLLFPVLVGVLVVPCLVLDGRYHYSFERYSPVEKPAIPYVKTFSSILIMVGIFNIVLDICYWLNISTPIIKNAVQYFIIDSHSTLYAFIKFGLAEKPFRTVLYLLYAVVAIVFGLLGLSTDIEFAKKELKD